MPVCSALDITDGESAVNLYKAGQLRAALRKIDKIEQEDKLDAKLSLLRYEIYKKTGKLKQAKAALLKALELDRECYEAHVALAIMALENSNSKEAKEHFRLALDINKNLSNSADLLYYYAKICVLDKDFDLALKNILGAIEINGDESVYYLELGKIYLHKADYLKAVNAFEYAIGSNQEVNSECYNYIGLANYKRGNLKIALEYFEKAIKLAPDNLIFLNNLALCQKSLNMMNEYKDTILILENTPPEKPIEYLQLSQILYSRKNYAGARQTVEMGLSRFPDNLLLKSALNQLNKL